MKKSLIIFLMLSVTPAFSYEMTGKVIKIADGDTVTLMSSDYSKYKIRLLGIDAPEKSQPFGRKSKRMLANLIGRKVVTAQCTGKDRYRRHLCTLYYRHIDVNGEMVANGGAWVYRRYYKGRYYYRLENQAKSKGLGLWKTSESKAIPPWDWRHRKVSANYYNSDTSVHVKLSRNRICHVAGSICIIAHQQPSRKFIF